MVPFSCRDRKTGTNWRYRGSGLEPLSRWHKSSRVRLCETETGHRCHYWVLVVTSSSQLGPPSRRRFPVGPQRKTEVPRSLGPLSSRDSWVPVVISSPRQKVCRRRLFCRVYHVNPRRPKPHPSVSAPTRHPSVVPATRSRGTKTSVGPF